MIIQKFKAKNGASLIFATFADSGYRVNDVIFNAGIVTENYQKALEYLYNLINS